MQSDETLIDGHRVVLITRMSGTDRGGFMGMHPTGRFVEVPMVLLFDLENGLIARERRIYDFTGLAVQVGAIKAKPV
jgi:predicted ester cyclase